MVFLGQAAAACRTCLAKSKRNAIYAKGRLGQDGAMKHGVWGKIRAVLRGSNDVANVELDDVSTRTKLKRPPSNYTRGSVRGSSGIGVSSRGSGGSGAQPGPVSSHSPAGAAQRFNGVEYIIGGKGSTTPVNINIPSLFPSSLGDRNPFGAAPMPPSFVSPAGNPAFMPPAMGQSFEQQRP
jgi:hypothetical protein